jgi:uncharacterized protein YqjF (DUF2071 family)
MGAVEDLPMNRDLWTEAFLDEMRLAGDPLADAAIDEMFSHGDIASVNRLMDSLTRNDGVPAANLPQAVRDYLAGSAAFPPFDAATVATAQDLFVRHGPEILSVYGFYSLPAAYAARRGVQVIHRSGYLAKRPVRRAFETVQMVVDVLSPGGLAPAGRGVCTAQKVRLMHAAVRRILTHDPARPWDAELGVPINQEDLAGTLMTFSCLILEGLARLGVALTPAEQSAYHVTWMGVGRLLGVREDLLPETPDDARDLTLRIYRRQIDGSPEGHHLLSALLDGYAGLVPPGPLAGAPRNLVHHFLDAEPITGRNVSALLGLSNAGFAEEITRAAVGLAGLAGAFLGTGTSPVAAVARQLGLVTTKAILALDRGGSRAPFHIPPDLLEGWWSRDEGDDGPISGAHDLASAESRIVRVMTRSAAALLDSAATAAMPPWKIVGTWRDLLFASWPLPVSSIRPLVPRELDLDLFEGQAWVTLVPMRMENVRWPELPAATATPSLTELNLRTYVRRGDFRGVYFLSIDVDSAWIDVAASATLDLPATLAKMTYAPQGDGFHFESQRIQPGAPSASLACSYRVTGALADIAPGTLPAFLLERFSMFFASNGKVMRGDIQHEPWKVAPVEVVLSVNTVAAAAGIALPDTAPHLLYSPGSDTVVLPLVAG